MQKVSRLLEQFIPQSYSLTWDLTKIGLPERHVVGTAIIQGTRKNSATITLHAKALTVMSITVNNRVVDSFVINGDELVMTSEGTGEVEIAITYTLSVTDAMHGIYPCYYKVDDAKQEVYATQFESHHAREAFPCIDEPAAKATYDITLVTRDAETVLSNMPITAQEQSPAGTTTKFATTPRMSSYLVAFVVGNLQRATTTTQHGVEVNVYATKAHSPAALTYALEHAEQTIDFFDDYFGTPYPLPKSDHVALPDFSSGAMENWGLVTYREIALLADPETVSIEGKQYVAEVVAHELSHQWFGNLVTMQWWDNLWLNESFATVMEYLAPNAFHPQWNLWFEFSTNEGVMALRRDCIDGVQSVQVDVNHPDEISSLFDGAIVYAKGGRLIRMMQTWIGEAAFRSGLKQYFADHEYGNTTGDDLWNALSAASGKDVGALMNAWISQSGYPVVTAALDSDTLTLTQERFFVGPHKPDDTLWPIPLRSNDDSIPDLLDTQSVSVPYTSPRALHLNSDDSGHYIVNYDETLRQRIITEITQGKLSEIQRAQFLHEQLMLARAGYTSSATLVTLLQAYRHETNEKVWGIIALAIADLKRFVENDQAAEKNLRRIAGELARPLYATLGWDPKPGESEDDTKLRATIIGLMLYSEDEAAIHQAIELYHVNKPESLTPELRSLILSAAVRHGNDDTTVDNLLKFYTTTANSDLQNDVAAALTSSKDAAVLTRLIGLLTDTHTIRSQDTVRWFVNLLRNRDGQTATWNWMRQEWPWIEKTFASDKSHDYFPRYSANLLGTRQQLQEYRDFFTPLRDNPSLTRSIDMGVLDLEGRIALLERDGPAVAAALTEF
jgi:aminopeptidase N